MVKNTELLEIFSLYQNESKTQKELMDIPLPRLPIAYIELVAALVGISVFSKFQPKKLITLYSDNTDVVAWLRKGRCSAGIGFKWQAGIAFYKRKYRLKISPAHIPGIQNNCADLLSRGYIPTWLEARGKRIYVDVDRLTALIRSPLHFWTQLWFIIHNQRTISNL